MSICKHIACNKCLHIDISKVVRSATCTTSISREATTDGTAGRLVVAGLITIHDYITILMRSATCVTNISCTAATDGEAGRFVTAGLI